MTTAFQILWPIAAGTASWFVTHFVGSPFLKLREMRAEASEKVREFAKVRARYKQQQDGSLVKEEELSEAEEERLAEAQKQLRSLSLKMEAFVRTNAVAVRMAERWLNWDPLMASKALLGVSNTLDRYGSDRAHWKQKLDEALGFPRDL